MGRGHWMGNGQIEGGRVIVIASFGLALVF